MSSFLNTNKGSPSNSTKGGGSKKEKAPVNITCIWNVDKANECGQTFETFAELHSHISVKHNNECLSTGYCYWGKCRKKFTAKELAQNPLMGHFREAFHVQPKLCDIEKCDVYGDQTKKTWHIKRWHYILPGQSLALCKDEKCPASNLANVGLGEAAISRDHARLTKHDRKSLEYTVELADVKKCLFPECKDFEFQHPKYLESHNQRAHQVKPAPTKQRLPEEKCPMCNKHFKTVDQHRKSLRSLEYGCGYQKVEQFRCLLCTYNTFSYKMWREHVSEKHKLSTSEKREEYPAQRVTLHKKKVSEPGPSTGPYVYWSAWSEWEWDEINRRYSSYQTNHRLQFKYRYGDDAPVENPKRPRRVDSGDYAGGEHRGRVSTQQREPSPAPAGRSHSKRRSSSVATASDSGDANPRKASGSGGHHRRHATERPKDPAKQSSSSRRKSTPPSDSSVPSSNKRKGVASTPKSSTSPTYTEKEVRDSRFCLVPGCEEHKPNEKVFKKGQQYRHYRKHHEQIPELKKIANDYYEAKLKEYSAKYGQ